MKKLKNISYAAAVFLVTTATSCNKQLEEDNPHETTIENQYTNPEGFTTLVNTAYQDLHEFYGNEDGEFELEAGTDLWYAGGRGTYARQYVYYDGLGPSQNQGTKGWQYAYRSINYCNLGISLIDEAGFTDETLKNQRLSELRFLRAMYYYHIVEQFGNVVLRTEPSSEGAEPLDYRSPVEDFYDVMISDLEFARDNLPVSWSASEYSRASKKSAMGLLARVLLTRAYYSSGSDAQSWFTKAKDAAVDAINNQGSLGISLYPTYAEIAPSIYGSNRQNNKEAMFVLAYSETNASSNFNVTTNGNEIFKWTLTKYISKPGMTGSYVNAYGWDGGENRLMPTWHFLDLFDETIDARYAACFNEVWISNVSSPYTWTTADVDPAKYDMDASVVGQQVKAGDTALYLTKNALPYDRRFKNFIAVGRNDLYVNPQHGQGANIVSGTVISPFYPSFKKWINVNKTTTTNADFGDAMIIRLAEMYMIAAEAYLQLGDNANAASMINVIRKRAAIPGHETEMEITAGDVDINFILDERARELAGEQQRWYDLKRVYHDKQAWADYIKKWNPDITLIQPYHWLRPIPKAELDAIENAAEFGQNEGYQ